MVTCGDLTSRRSLPLLLKSQLEKTIESLFRPLHAKRQVLAGQLLANFYGAGNGLTLVRQAGRRPRLVFFRQIALEWTSSAATSAGSAAGTEATSSSSSWSSEPPRRPPVAGPVPPPRLRRHHPLRRDAPTN